MNLATRISAVAAFCGIFTILSPLAANEAATEVSRTHVGNLLKANWDSLEETYAEKVKLMPGHEFLKSDYGLAPGRDKAVEVDRAKLIEAMRKASEGRERPGDAIDGFLESLRFETLETTPGFFQADPSDPGARLKFEIKKGDALVKISPPKGDFFLVHLRGQGDGWKVVSEYLD